MSKPIAFSVLSSCRLLIFKIKQAFNFIETFLLISRTKFFVLCQAISLPDLFLPLDKRSIFRLWTNRKRRKALSLKSLGRLIKFHWFQARSLIAESSLTPKFLTDNIFITFLLDLA